MGLIFVVVECLILECQVALAVCSSSILSSKMIVVKKGRSAANEAFSCLLVSMNILSSHDHELFNTENVAVCRRAAARKYQLHHLLHR